MDRKDGLHGREVRYDARQPNEEPLQNNAGRLKKAVVRLVRLLSLNHQRDLETIARPVMKHI